MAILKYMGFLGSTKVQETFRMAEPEDETEYSYEELDTYAQAKAIDNFRSDEDLIPHDWYKEMVKEFEDELAEIGIEDVDFQFSGFYSQGDGASFTGSITDNKKFIEDVLGIRDLRPEVYDNLTIEIKRSQSRYVHENTVDVEVDLEETELEFPVSADFSIIIDMEKEAGKIEEKGNDWLRSKCREFYRKLEDEYESFTSDDYIENFITANDYKFDKEGNLI